MSKAFLFALTLTVIGCSTTDREWRDTVKDGSIAAYQKFVDEHPDSIHINDAHFSINLKKYDEAKRQDSIQGYETFIREYPDSREYPGLYEYPGLFIKKAKDRLDELMWLDAKNTNTIRSYQDYLNKQPDGNHLWNAKVNIDWMDASSKNTIEAYRSFLRVHKYSEFSDTAKERIDKVEIPKFTDCMRKCGKLRTPQIGQHVMEVKFPENDCTKKCKSLHPGYECGYSMNTHELTGCGRYK